MAAARAFTLLLFTGLFGLVLLPARASAQWWTAAPADYEDCAERAQKSAASSDAKSTALSECDGKFAGRRKPGGGYTYHDFMQNRTFDIAGPNPTAAEQKVIDEHYTSYLDNQRRTIIAAAFAEKQRQQLAALQVEPTQPAPVIAKDIKPKGIKPVVAVARPKPHASKPNCSNEPLACGWSRLSAGWKDIGKTLFGPPAKTRRS